MNNTHLIKYSCRLASGNGITGSVIDDVKGIGYRVIRYERPNNLRCYLIEVENIVKNSPSHIELMAPLWEFKN